MPPARGQLDKLTRSRDALRTQGMHRHPRGVSHVGGELYGLGMATITVLPATADRFDAVEHALSGGGDGRSCQCQWWTLTSAQFDRTPKAERAELLRRETESPRAPGLVAEVDGASAGWVRVGPRTAQPRLSRTRLYGPHSPEPWEDDDVWAISCFSIRREFRGQGLSAKLLARAVEFARTHDARVIEGYPVDTAVATVSSNELYHGTLRTFLAAGFVETARPREDRPLVALRLR